MISMMLEASRRVLYLTTFTSGLMPLMAISAESTFGVPIRSVVWMTWRCRLERSTSSSSTTPSVPTPAAARYSAVGEPSPPAPSSSTFALSSFVWPSSPISGTSRWRE